MADDGAPGTANEASTTIRPVLPSSSSCNARIDGDDHEGLSNNHGAIPTMLPRSSSSSTIRNQSDALPLSVLSFASIHRPDHILPIDGDGNTDYDMDMTDTGFEESRVNSPTPITGSVHFQVDRLSSNDGNHHMKPTFVPMRLEPQPGPNLELELEDKTTARGIDLFFQHVCHHHSFIHRPTFDIAGSPRYLRLAMAALGLQYEDHDLDHSRFHDPVHNDTQDHNDKHSEAQRRSRRYYQAALDLAGRASKIVKDGSGKLAIVQTYLLLQACGMLYLGGEEAVQGGKLHFEMVSVSDPACCHHDRKRWRMVLIYDDRSQLCRSSGLFQPSPMDPTNTSDLESLWRHFVQSESHKR